VAGSQKSEVVNIIIIFTIGTEPDIFQSICKMLTSQIKSNQIKTEPNRTEPRKKPKYEGLVASFFFFFFFTFFFKKKNFFKQWKDNKVGCLKQLGVIKN